MFWFVRDWEQERLNAAKMVMVVFDAGVRGPENLC